MQIKFNFNNFARVCHSSVPAAYAVVAGGGGFGPTFIIIDLACQGPGSLSLSLSLSLCHCVRAFSRHANSGPQRTAETRDMHGLLDWLLGL